MKRLLCLVLFFTITKTISAQDSIYTVVDKQVKYDDAENSWIEYLEKNLHANVPVNNGAPLGKYTVLVKFIVDEKGNTTNVYTTTNNGYGMEEEAIRVIKKVQKWIPASKNGKPVKAYRIQPITFIISDE